MEREAKFLTQSQILADNLKNLPDFRAICGIKPKPVVSIETAKLHAAIRYGVRKAATK